MFISTQENGLNQLLKIKKCGVAVQVKIWKVEYGARVTIQGCQRRVEDSMSWKFQAQLYAKDFF